MKANSPLTEYIQLVNQHMMKTNIQQFRAIQLLDKLHTRLRSYDPQPIMPDVFSIESKSIGWSFRNLFKAIFSIKNLLVGNSISKYPKGIYFHGGVGTGKSMLMDLFFNSVNIKRKRRTHFHAFMQDIHKRIHEKRSLRGQRYDPIPLIAAELSMEAWLICFDEFQVTDIADAMLLRYKYLTSRLCEELFKHGVVMVVTSNRHPDDLYQNGIQRSSFLGTIKLIIDQCQIFLLDSGFDYRKQAAEIVPVFFKPLNDHSKTAVQTIFRELTKNLPVCPKKIYCWGRMMIIAEAAGRIGKSSFRQLCEEPHSAADYLEISREFDILFIEDIPALDFSSRNEARRFITLIDTLYDHKCKIICSMDSAVGDIFLGKSTVQQRAAADEVIFDDLTLEKSITKSSIFNGEEEIFAFQRAASRLMEMQSLTWVGKELADSIKVALVKLPN